MPQIQQIQKQIIEFVGSLSVKQRAMLIGAAVLTVAILAAFTRLISTPEYAPLMTGMEPADAQALGSKLAAKNIAYEISPDGKTVSVPKDKLDSSRMEVVSDGMPRSGRMGFELFDKLNWGQTEFDEKVNYQRALEGELERSIQTLRDVESVRVHLVMPTESVFLDRERAAKASVVLRLRSGRLSEETQLGIARLVSGAVDTLSPENVIVVDADTNRPLGTGRSNPYSVDANLEQLYTARLMQTIEPIVGEHNARASVNIEYDPSSSEENAETYDPQSAVAVASQKSEEQVGGSAMGGVPGTSSNVPNGNSSKVVVDGGDQSQLSKSESNTFVVNKLIRHTVQPAGRIRRITAALLVDDAVDATLANGKRTEVRRKRTPEELKQIEELAKASIGIDANRGDTLTVQSVSFSQLPVDSPAKPPMADRVRTVLNDWSSVVRYACLIILFAIAYMMILRPVKKQILRTFRELPASLAASKGELSVPRQTSALPTTELSDEQLHAATLKKQLMDSVKNEPVKAGKLIHAWIGEEVH